MIDKVYWSKYFNLYQAIKWSQVCDYHKISFGRADQNLSSEWISGSKKQQNQTRCASSTKFGFVKLNKHLLESWLKEFEAVRSDGTSSDISLRLGCFANVKVEKNYSGAAKQKNFSLLNLISTAIHHITKQRECSR